MKLYPIAFVFCALCLASFAYSQTNTTATDEFDKSLLEGIPLIRKWPTPVYPPELVKEKLRAEVLIHYIIDETGVVSKAKAVYSTDQRFSASAIAAIESATYEAGLSEGKPIAMGVASIVIFEPLNPKTMKPIRHVFGPVADPLPKIPPQAINTPFDTNFPAWLRTRIKTGVVVAELVIDTSGNVSNVIIQDASHPDFVVRAIERFQSWTFEPAYQGDLKIEGRSLATLEFFGPSERKPSDTDSDILSVDIPEGKSLLDLCTYQPTSESIIDPVYPYELATSGTEGEATVSFVVNEDGYIKNIVIRSASDPQFGHALATAISESKFTAGSKLGQKMSVPMTWKHVFKQPPAIEPAFARGESTESAESRQIRRLIAGETAKGAKGLDGRLRPILRINPIYPEKLKEQGIRGSAEIEFIIERSGRTCLPRIVKATHEEFGWAAASAASQWVFNPPTRQGEPTEVKVMTEFSF